ncbi:hypothetical protein HD554DRAFT_2207296 [Boletus coccyginus]|nr:hypothetical protein HD554DRAFT_2207296 [Boletus coccyginus]
MPHFEHTDQFVPNQCGHCGQAFPTQTAQTTCILHAQAAGEYSPEFIAKGLHPIFSPFWTDLPHSDIFTCITSDILHQQHQEIIKDHLKKWYMAITGKKSFNSWFQATPFHLGLPYCSHTNETLQGLQDALNDFHTLKDVFISLSCREHFNIPKLHLLVHYIESIQLFSSFNGFNTENLEWLHINYAKKDYAATN